MVPPGSFVAVNVWVLCLLRNLVVKICVAHEQRMLSLALLPWLALLQATAAGVKETEATNMLEKKFRSGPQYSRKEVIEVAISVLQVGTCCACSGAAIAHAS